MTLNIPLKHALSKQNIRINVPSSFTIGISTEPSIMQNAATRLLGLPQNDIEKLAEDIIFGQLRLTVASLTIEQVNQDRDSFLRIVFTNVDTELHKLGLYLINVNVVDITDERQYIESIGTKAAETAVNEALVETAIARSTGELGRAKADREREVGVAQNSAESEKGQKEAEVNRRIFVMQQEAMGKQGENVSAAEIADFEADLMVAQADARKRAEVAQRIAQKDIESAQYELEGERLRALEVVREEVSKKTVEIAAEVEAERQRRIAQGQADAIFARY
jgi:flotillin